MAVCDSLSVFMPAERPLIVRLISVISLGIGLLFIVPFLLLIIYDFGLWAWRHLATQSDRAASMQRHPGVASAKNTAKSMQGPMRKID